MQVNGTCSRPSFLELAPSNHHPPQASLTYGDDGSFVVVSLKGAGKYPFLRVGQPVVDMGEGTVGSAQEGSFTLTNQARGARDSTHPHLCPAPRSARGALPAAVSRRQPPDLSNWLR